MRSPAHAGMPPRMRSIVMTATLLCLVVTYVPADARGARTRHRAPAGGGSRAGSRSRVAPDGLPNTSQCDTPRAAAVYGSSARCLHALCAGQNVTNAYVLDHAHRLQRNPCAGADAFDAGR